MPSIQNETVKIVLGAFFILACGGAGGAVFPHTDPENEGGWVLQTDMSDEFDGAELDEEKWLIQGRGGVYRHNFIGREWWQFSPDNVRLENGMLKIRTQYEPDYAWVNPGTNQYAFTTAGISTKKTFYKGYMEIRSKSADASVVCAFWTTGAKGVGSELDVFESIGRPSHAVERTNLMWSSIHDWKLPPKNYVWTETTALPFNFSDGFHIYGAEWDGDSVKIYADGELIHETSREWVEKNGMKSKRWPLIGGQHVWIDSEIFPWWGKPDPARLPADYEVDYVRIWEKAE